MRRPSRFARVVVACRWPVLAFWAAALLVAVLLVPGASSTKQGKLGGLVSTSNPALVAEQRALRQFGLPVLSNAFVVQRDPHGLSPLAQADAARGAAEIDAGRAPARLSDVAGALPVSNSLAIPGAKERGTSVITFLYLDPSLSLRHQQLAASEYARTYLSASRDHVIGVGGAAPARATQLQLVDGRIQWVELATLVVIAGVVGIVFTSVFAPLLALVTAATAYLLVEHVGTWLASLVGTSIPTDFRPIIVALVLGVVTDYTVFQLAALRRHVRRDRSSAEAARLATSEVAAPVFTAGVIVSVGMLALLAARLPVFAKIGPALAITVGIGMVVAITLVPAAMAVGGRRLFWPGHDLRTQPRPPERARGLPKLLAHHWFAALVALVCVAALGAAAWQAPGLRLGFPLGASLPPGTAARRAQDAAAQGFNPGMVAPTEVIISAPHVTNQRAALERLQRALSRQDGVAGVVGPRQQRTPLRLGAAFAPSGNAARYAVMLERAPLSARSIGWVRNLQVDLPRLARRAGLHGVHVEVAGQTAIAADVIRVADHDAVVVGAVILLVEFLALVLFLRALIAPLLLLASTFLGLAATFGLAVWLFQGVLGHGSITFYVPFAAGVLLITLGSDYDVFTVSNIWDEARRRSVDEAVGVGVPNAARVIDAAGGVLAASFAMLALIPLRSSRELAFLLATGIAIDTLVIRSVLVPSLIVLVGRWNTWPFSRLGQRTGTPRPPAPRSTTATANARD